MREIVFDTETTGLDPLQGHRLVEIGCVELVNRFPSGRVFHRYFNPDRDMPAEAFAVIYDSPSDRDYDLEIAVQNSLTSTVLSGAVLRTSRFEARPSACYDPQGRLWIAYEEGPARWGKDYGALNNKDGHPLYNERAVKVVCRTTDGKLYRPAAELPASDEFVT